MASTIDLRPEIVNVKLYEGDTWFVEVALTEPGTTTPMNLTGADISATLRPKNGDPDVALTIIDGDLTQGEFFYGQHNASLDEVGKYDVQVVLNTAPRTYIRGSISVDADITPE